MIQLLVHGYRFRIHLFCHLRTVISRFRNFKLHCTFHDRQLWILCVHQLSHGKDLHCSPADQLQYRRLKMPEVHTKIPDHGGTQLEHCCFIATARSRPFPLGWRLMHWMHFLEMHKTAALDSILALREFLEAY